MRAMRVTAGSDNPCRTTNFTFCPKLFLPCGATLLSSGATQKGTTRRWTIIILSVSMTYIYHIYMYVSFFANRFFAGLCREVIRRGSFEKIGAPLPPPYLAPFIGVYCSRYCLLCTAGDVYCKTVWLRGKFCLA